MSYISSNANRFYTALESAYGQVGRSRRQPDSGGEAGESHSNSRPSSGRTRREAGHSPACRRRQAAHGFRPADVHDELAERSSRDRRTGRCFRRRWGGADDLRGRNGGIQHDRRQAGLSGAARAGGGAGGGVRRRDPVRGGDRGREHGAAERAVHGTPAAGGAVAAAVTYAPATELPSVSMFDYWTPATAVQRLLCGAAVDQMEISINGDYHEFRFSGLAQDVLDSSSFLPVRWRTLQSFPAEPALGGLRLLDRAGEHGRGVAGHVADAVLHDHSGSMVLKNNLDTRAKEFGIEPAAGDFAGPADGDGGIRALQPGRQATEGAVPGGAAAIADQRDVPVGRATRDR